MKVTVNKVTRNVKVESVTHKIIVRRPINNITVNQVGRRGIKGEPGEGVPTGGLAGQVLSKVSEDNYDTAWVDQTGGGGDVESVNGRTGVVTGLAEKAELDMVEEELYQDLTQGDATTLELAKDDAQERVDILDESLATVAKTGSYDDLLNKPVIPTPPVTSVNGRTGAVTGLAEQALLDMVEEELYEDLTNGDAATLASANTYTDTKVGQISFPVTSVAGKTGAVTLNNDDVGLGNVNNTSDIDKPISTAQAAADALKVDKVSNAERLYGTAAAGVQTSLPYTQLATPATIPYRGAGGVTSVGTATAATHAVPKAQMDAADALKADISSLSQVATSGNYNDLSNKPVIPVQPTFTANATTLAPGSNATANVSGSQTNPVINIGVPAGQQGASGMPNTDLVGSGQPNGVVSGAVGTIYKNTDRNAATWCGDFVWIKRTGTGNTGWEVLYGDTGWRRISGTLINFMTNELRSHTGNIDIRRTGAEVQFRVSALQLTPPFVSSVDTNTVIPLPVGFQGSQNCPVMNFDDTRQLMLSAETTRLRASAFPMSPWAGRLMYIAGFLSTSAWPTTLPGTPA